MTRQELAVASSHVHVWRRVAEQDADRVLILEDDAYFTRGFAARLDRVREQLQAEDDEFDVLYLSYMEADGADSRSRERGVLFDPVTGMWQLSGYVLTRRGARSLLARLPVVGPVDLWINHQFAHLNIRAVRRPVIRQRHGVKSSNLYSVLPVLSELGSISRERPLVTRPAKRTAPVFAYGACGSGHGSVAEALSMLGYRCCQDITALAGKLVDCAVDGSGPFDAYVNVGRLTPESWATIQRRQPRARFVFTVASMDALTEPDAAVVADLRRTDPAAAIVLAADDDDPWQTLVDLLDVPYPSHPYPRAPDMQARHIGGGGDSMDTPVPIASWKRADRSPWILPRKLAVGLDAGLVVEEPAKDDEPRNVAQVSHVGGELDDGFLTCREDTFPGNLALFQTGNVQLSDTSLTLELREDPSPVREYSSGAVATTRSYLYGRFSAELQACGVEGAVTGVFLHRSSPRQEIDIEILGRAPTQMLTNVYFNPGCDGDRIEYGYRGTPAVVELGFDASVGDHLFEIEWRRDVIRWVVDGRVMHVRHVWDPTPVPHRPMEFNVNLWPPRSRELAGRLRRCVLPATARVVRLAVASTNDGDPRLNISTRPLSG